MKNPVFCALDTTETEAALALGRRLGGLVGGLKLGLEFFTANGPDGVRAVAAAGRSLCRVGRTSAPALPGLALARLRRR